MSKCFNCTNGQMSFSRVYSELEGCEVPSYQIYCKALGRVVANVPDPRAKFSAPNDCPVGDIDEKKYFKDLFKKE